MRPLIFLQESFCSSHSDYPSAAVFEVSNTLQIWASLAAYVAKSSNATGQSTRVGKIISAVAHIADNVAEATKKQEGAVNREVYTTLLEAARKAVPKSSSKRKASADQASASAKRNQVHNTQATTLQHSVYRAAAENAVVGSNEEGVAREPRSPPTTPRSTDKSRSSMDLSPPTGSKE